MVDSWGKVPDGFLFGHFNPWGMMEECVAVVANSHVTLLPPSVPPLAVDFKGHYCLVKYRYVSTDIYTHLCA